MKLSDIMVSDAIVADLSAEDRDAAIEEMVQSLAEAGAAPKKNVQEIIDAVLERESQATTGIGRGVALPHAKLKCIKKAVGAIGRSSAGIDFYALDSKPVHSVILLLSNPENPDEHLQAMETIFKHVQREIFRKFLRQSETKQAIVELIEEADEIG
jgi:mannitol/fructose-specific phosphotransferase system IIA component (Ntr-type)